MFCVLVTEAWFARLHLENEDDERFAKYHSGHAKGALGGFQRHKGLPKLTTKDVPLRSIAKFPRQRARLILDLNGQNDYAVEGITEDREIQRVGITMNLFILRTTTSRMTMIVGMTAVRSEPVSP
jgi:hypothetical protein